MIKQLEMAATLFFWMLAIEISFLPTMTHHQIHPPGQPSATSVRNWQKQMNKVLIAFLVLAALNLIEKIIIQLIAISFHQRTYEDRIELNKFQIGSLTKLYAFSKLKLKEMQDSDFEAPSAAGIDHERPKSGAITPGAVLEKAQKNTQKAVQQFGDVAGKIAGDFTGRAVLKSSHPSQVVLSLLSSTGGSQVLARRLYRTFNREVTETVHQTDLTEAFENESECDAAFAMFDKDMNGDISMEELEAVCVEIGRERKAITASLKDLDSVVSKLDDCFMFIVVVISILVLISLISSAAATGISNAGSVVLALSWLFSATAQEFLQSVIFVFVKHPFDVGDRVTIYGTTGAALSGDDYFVKEIALLYTEFKKMEGQVVQAPNSYLNTLFILNMRRSGGLAEAVPVIFKFGTSIDQIDLLRQKLLDFVKSEKREYQSNILTELRSIDEAHQISLNIVFFFKSNWQNELLRLQRRNKFICAMMIAIQECGIEGPRMRYPGQRETFPLYTQHMPLDESMRGRGGHPDNPQGMGPTDPQSSTSRQQFPSFDGTAPDAPTSRARGPSISLPRNTRDRSESQIATKGRRYDLSLGLSEVSAGNMTGDVFDDVSRPVRVPAPVQQRTSNQRSRERNSKERGSADIARTTSRAGTFGPGMLNRASTEGVSVHRNRFFSRASRETRQSHDVERMESGMAGIPEGVSPPNGQAYSQVHGQAYGQVNGQANGQAQGQSAHMDPRTGLVSPRAFRLSTDNSIGPEMTEGGRPLFSGPGGEQGRPRSSVEGKRL